jgi:hypothetical protein
MNWEKRFEAFVHLGNRIKTLNYEEFLDIKQRAAGSNPWFTEEYVNAALKGVETYLDKKRLSLWLESYNLNSDASFKIGVVMAGNIPLAGFHDFLCVLMSGYKLKAKLSSQDSYLPRKIAELLIEIEPGFEEQIEFVELLKDIDAVIATGSGNSARYFNYYFANKPHIIRKNRNSCAVLNGNENEEDFRLLGKDIFTYFGLGCRSISKIYVPAEYDLSVLLDGLKSFSDIINHHKYANNYDYNKSIYLINQIEHLDNGFLLLKQDTGLASPISVVYYERYKDHKELSSLRLASIKESIQCIVSKESWFPGSIDLGKAQIPELWEYADGIDTMRFLQSLKY